jgi:Ca-activated chloride channel family protein
MLMKDFVFQLQANERLNHILIVLFLVLVSVALINFFLEKKWLPIIVRISALCSLAFALVDPALVWDDADESRFSILLDISQSMRTKVLQDSIEMVKSIVPEGTPLDVIPFAGTTSSIAQSSDNASSIRTTWSSTLKTETTDLNAALAAAKSTGKNFLITDGYSHTTIEAGTSFKGRIYPIVVDLPPLIEEKIEIDSIEAPTFAKPNSEIRISATIKNSQLNEATDTITITHEGKDICTKNLTLPPNSSRKISCKFRTPKVGFAKLTATTSSESRHAYITINSKKRLLLISGNKKDEAFLKKILTQESFQIDNYLPPPKKDMDLEQYFTVILNNVDAKSLGEPFVSKIASSLRSGTGLVVFGGSRAFGLGQYHQSELNRIIPVESVPPRKEKKRVNVAIALVLDKSNSMNSDSKIIYTRRAATEVVYNLKDDDFISVIGFDQNPFILIRMSSVGSIRSKAARTIQHLTASKSSKLLPALDEARRALAKVDAGRKHIIVLSDGAVGGSLGTYISLASQMNTMGITISSVLIGSDQSLVLQNLAHYGGGKFYETTNVNSLPRIFIQDVEITTGERTLKENENYTIRRGTAPITITKENSFPSLRGYVETRFKSNANNELITGSLKEPHPLLAHFKVGKGKSIAFTSDINGIWSNRLLSWSKIHSFLRRIVDYSRSENSSKSPLDYTLLHYAQNGLLALDMTVFDELIDSEITMRLTTPSGVQKTSLIRPHTKGHYLHETSVSETGEYTLTLESPEKAPSSAKFYLDRLPNIETESDSYNLELLAEIATQSGGQINPTASEVAEQTVQKTNVFHLTPLVLILTFLLLILEIYTRELWS